MSDLGQIIQQNPAWPAIPGQGPWAGLPPELRPVFKQLEDQTYVGSLSWWINLVFLGAIGYDFLTCLPSDIKMVWWPEIQRCLLRRHISPNLRGASNVSSGSNSASWRRTHPGPDPTPISQGRGLRGVRGFKFPRPIIISHLAARLLVIVYFVTIINYYRLPKSCNAALHAALLTVGLASINAQCIMTLRCMAISRTMPHHRILWLALWAYNLFFLALWFLFVFTTHIAQTFPAAQPFGFRIGFRCGTSTDLKWVGMVMYLSVFVEDLVIFLVSLFAISSVSAVYTPGQDRWSRIDTLSSLMRTLWAGFRAMSSRIFANHDYHEQVNPIISAVSTQFIIDSIRCFLSCLVMEAAGIGLNAAFTLRKHPDTTRTSWILVLHAVIAFIVCPRIINNSRTLTLRMERRNEDTRGQGAEGGAPHRRSKSNAMQGIHIQSTVHHHTEKVEDPILADMPAQRGKHRPDPAHFYPPPVILENINTLPRSTTNHEPPSATSGSHHFRKSDEEDLEAYVSNEPFESRPAAYNNSQHSKEADPVATPSYLPPPSDKGSPSAEDLGYHAS